MDLADSTIGTGEETPNGGVGRGTSRPNGIIGGSRSGQADVTKRVGRKRSPAQSNHRGRAQGSTHHNRHGHRRRTLGVVHGMVGQGPWKGDEPCAARPAGHSPRHAMDSRAEAHRWRKPRISSSAHGGTPGWSSGPAAGTPRSSGWPTGCAVSSAVPARSRCPTRPTRARSTCTCGSAGPSSFSCDGTGRPGWVRSTRTCHWGSVSGRRSGPVAAGGGGWPGFPPGGGRHDGTAPARHLRGHEMYPAVVPDRGGM
jgi:hypothetical protein